MCNFTEGRDVHLIRYLERIGFTATDLAVEKMTVNEMKNHLDVLRNKLHGIWVPGIGNPMHDILGIWGVPIPPGYTLDVPEGDNSQVVRYCEYHYVDRKYFTVKLFGGSLYYTGTAVISRRVDNKE